MKRSLITIIILVIFWSFAQSTKKRTTNDNSVVSAFNYEDFEIKKGQLGEIKIGMTISEAERKFSGLRKEVDVAVNFGYGGGSPAYLYYDNKEIVFGLIPELNTDVVIVIVAVSPKLTTTNGLKPNSTVREITKIYPNTRVNEDYMNSWEVIKDTTNNWHFIFWTDEKSIGNYPEYKVSSEIINTDIKSDWIAIE